MSSIKPQSFECAQQQQQQPFYYQVQQNMQINNNYNNVNNDPKNFYSNYTAHPDNINNTNTIDTTQQLLQPNMFYSDSLNINNDVSNINSSKPIQVSISSNNDEYNKYQQLLQQQLLYSQREYKDNLVNENPKIHHWSSITPRASDLVNIESVKTLSTKSNEKCFGNFTSSNEFNENNVENVLSSTCNNLINHNVRCIVFDETNNQYVEDNSKLNELNCIKPSPSLSTSSSVHNTALNINNLRIRANSISPLNSLNDKNITNKLLNNEQDIGPSCISLSLPASSMLTLPSALTTPHNRSSMLSMEVPLRSTCLGILDQIEESSCDNECQELNTITEEVMTPGDETHVDVGTDRESYENLCNHSLVERGESYSSISPDGNKERIKYKPYNNCDNDNNDNDDADDEEIIVIPLPSIKSMSPINLALQAKQNEHERNFKQQQQLQQQLQQVQVQHHKEVPIQQLQQYDQINYCTDLSAYQQYYWYYYYYYYNQMMLQNQNQNQYNNIQQMHLAQHYQALQNCNNQMLPQYVPANQNNNNYYNRNIN